MAAREASLKVTLQPASFQAGLRRMEQMTKASGQRMGRALKEPMSAGLKSAKQSMTGLMNGLKTGIKMAATLGGALSFAGLAKDAISMQNTYRNIAFNVNKVAGNTETWESIQTLVNSTVQKTGRSASELSEAFIEVFEATGDLEFARKSMETIGTTATATGHSIGALATTMQLASRKFDVGADGIDDAMTRMIEKTGVGGKGIEELTNRFAVMAGEAGAAGMKGGKGISQLLGIMLKLDSSIGEKADPGLKQMFQTLKGGTTQFIRLKKAMGGMKFEADMTAMDKMKAILQSKSGRAMAEQTFIADARVAYDTLAAPFEEAMKVAQEQGATRLEAMAKGAEAFDRSLAEMSKSSMKFSAIQNEANQRQIDDPMVRMNKALARISDAFTKPQMIAAMNKLADKIPAFADAVVWALNKLIDNPWESIAVLVGGKIALAFAGSAITNAVATGMKSLFATIVAGQAATTGAAVATTVASTAGGTALGAGSTLVAGGTVAGGLAAAGGAAIAGAVLVGAGVGAGIGTLGFEYGGGRAGIEGEAASLRRSDLAISASGRAIGGGDDSAMSQALVELRMARANLKASESVFNTLVSGAAVATGQAEMTSGETLARKTNALVAEEVRLHKALQDLRRNTDVMSRSMLNAAFAVDSSRGPKPPANSSPGAPPGTGEGVGG